jgi:hypothetical protein
MSPLTPSDRNRWPLVSTVLLLGLISLVQPGCDCGSSGSFSPAVIASVLPPANSDNALTSTNVIAVFGIDMNEDTINDTTFTLTEVGGALQAAIVSYDPISRSATLDPDTDLNPDTQYRATISAAVEDSAGNNPLGSDFSWSFTTAPSFLLISSNGDGIAGNNQSTTPDIDVNGRYVVFVSSATNLVNNTTLNGLNQVYRKDTLTGEVILVSSDGSGIVPANRDCASPRISDNGRFVVFESAADNLDDDLVSSGISQIYLKNLDTNTIELVSRDLLGNPDNGSGGASSADVSDDGRYIVFQSRDPDLSATPGNTFTQIYRKDINNEDVVMISRTNAGAAGDNASQNADISPDGTHIVFESSAINLGATGGNQHIFYVDADAATHTVELISTSAGGDANNDSFNPSVTDDGSFVAFDTLADNLDINDSNGAADIYLRNRSLPDTGLVSVNSSGNSGNRASTNAQISGNGNYVAFESGASDIDGGTLGVQDIFVRDMTVLPTIEINRINITVSGFTTSNTVNPVISTDGRYVSFESEESYTLDNTGGLANIYRAINSTYQ